MAHYHCPTAPALEDLSAEQLLGVAFLKQVLRDTTTGKGTIKAEASEFLQDLGALGLWAAVMGIEPERLRRCVTTHLHQKTS